MELFNFDNINVMEMITKKNRVMRLIFLLVGSFLAALFYNTFILRYNIVPGGIGGLAIIFRDLFNIPVPIFYNTVTGILIVLSLMIIGFKKTSYSIVGFFSFTIMLNLTEGIADFVYFKFDSFLFMDIIYSILAGFAYGLVYKAGFNTGGSDTIIAITQKFISLPYAALSNLINGVIIGVGAFTLGPINAIYGILYLKLSNYITDRVMLGKSDSKVCYIKTRKDREIENYLKKNLHLGYTLIESSNATTLLKRPIIMCVVPSERFLLLKNHLMEIDHNVTLISKDCYTVEGGHRNPLISV